MDKINICKYSLFQQLAPRSYKFLWSKPNEPNHKYKVYVFKQTDAPERDLAAITGHDYEKDRSEANEEIEES